VLFPLGSASISPASGGSLAYSGGLGNCGDPSILFSGHIVARFVKVGVNVTNPKKTRRLQAPRLLADCKKIP
jgi:hypothetical protein